MDRRQRAADRALHSLGVDCTHVYDLHWRVEGSIGKARSILEEQGRRTDRVPRVTPNPAYTEVGYSIGGLTLVFVTLRDEKAEIAVVEKTARKRAVGAGKRAPRPRVGVGEIISTKRAIPDDTNLAAFDVLKFADAKLRNFLKRDPRFKRMKAIPCELCADLDTLRDAESAVSVLAVFRNPKICDGLEMAGLHAAVKAIKEFMRAKGMPGVDALEPSESGLQGRRHLDLDGSEALKAWIINEHPDALRRSPRRR